MRYLIIVASLIVGLSSFNGHAAGTDIHWSYDGDTGPEFWGTLDSSFELCGNGLQQSPVDINNEQEEMLSPLLMNYENVVLDVLNNGHTIQVNVEALKGTLIYNNVAYELKQFHFHTPSEHTENGHSAPMEVHFVHQSEAEDIAVVGVFLKTGRENNTFKTILDYAPTAEGELLVPEVMVDMTALLPHDSMEFYHYMGSLTTPPCSEDLKWFVMDDPVHVSSEQVEQFITIFHANARPVQPLNDRVIYENQD